MTEKEVCRKRYLMRLSLVGLLISMSMILLDSSAVFCQASERLDLYKTKGTIIAEGKNTNSVGDLKLKTYRVEEVQLPTAMNVNVNGRNLEVNRAYKVTITAGFPGAIPVRDLPAIIWIDDTPLKYAQESEDLSEVTAITYDRSLLRDGAEIAFSFGEKTGSYTVLPEKLNFIASGKKGGNQ